MAGSVTTAAQPTKAVIYCRVSSKSQESEGHGLESQETRCRQYAASKGYEVVAVFPDTITGGGDFMNRPGMVALLSFLDAQPRERYVVIFDDLKRFARNREFHFRLRDSFRKRDAQVECLNFKFEDTPEGEFIETILAAQGQLERKQNGRQVSQKMKARLENGYWVFYAPPGYKYERVAGHGKLLVRDEPIASIIQEALEGFASGHFQTLAELKHFLEKQPAYPKDTPDGIIRYEKIARLMDRVVYTGHVEYPNWDVRLRKGHHQPIISLATYEAVQRRIKEAARAPFRKDISADFPLRGFVTCADCGNPLTSCWSTSKSGVKHPYYLCHQKGCPSYRKSIRRDTLEGEFAEMVRDMKPAESIFAMAKRMFSDAWGQRQKQAEADKAILTRDLATTEKKIEGLLDRIVDADSGSVITAYEKRLERLEREKLILAEKLENHGPDQGTFAQKFEHALAFLANPWKLWESGNLTLQRTLLKLAFAGRIAYARNEGLRTPKTTIPFKMLGGILPKKCCEATHNSPFFPSLSH